ncbi:MAG TPA: hypothetical protein VN924_32305 [Bryobacteraceae bacterium]|nr:hypothetical protein [Bryobacteraceae bacterium]
MLAARRYGWRVLPLLLLLALYWQGLTNWFYQDDFGWLNLRHDVHSFRDLGPALFAPKAHGNIRPLGENAYFLVFSSLFGVDPLPFRIWAFATQMASLALLGGIATRLTGSRAAGFWAQVLWIANTGLAAAMCWTSIYNQILSGFFFLLAFWFLLRYIESGAPRDAIGHWAAFVLGLGALETNVVYPAIAAVYALLFARAYVKKILPMFPVSALFVFVHFRVAPPPHDGVYALHIGGQLFSTLGTYWMWALGPSRLAAALLSCAALGLLVWSVRARQWVPAFGVAWFVIVTGPYLPLGDHKMDYYLTVPVAGLAIVGASAIAYAWRSKWMWRTAAAACIAIYLATSLPAAWTMARWHHDRGARVEDLVLGVADMHDAQPDKIILLDGVDSDLFWSGIVDLPFRAMEIPHVYLAPGSASRIQAPGDLVVKYILPQALALRALQEGRAVAYRVDGPEIRNVTGRYRAMAGASWKPETPRFINLGDSAFAEYAGLGWDECANGFRKLRRVATVHIGGPRGPDDRLYIGVFRTTDFRLGVRVDGVELSPRAIQRSGDLTEFGVQLPAALAGEPVLEVTLSNGEPEPLKFGYLDVR